VDDVFVCYYREVIDHKSIYRTSHTARETNLHLLTKHT